METTNSFGYWIRRQRKALDLTQQVLAERVGCSLAAIKKIEGDERRPSRQIAERIADVLGVPGSQREIFIECARGLRPVDQLVLAHEPVTSAPSEMSKSLPHNLPMQLTNFIGRERELEEVKHLLSNTRLLTLTGPGGTGKTRLAFQLGAEMLALKQFTNGIWLVELAPLADPTLVTQTIAATLGVREQPRTTLLDALTNYVRAKNMLLILDNCEHLIQISAQISESLLHAAPRLQILVTSREALGITGETVYRVPSLPLPGPQQLHDLEALEQNDCVHLFIDRAIAVYPSFRLTEKNAPAIANICQRLDGIPLAIELAAARTKVFPPDEIAARLDDRFKLLTGGSRTALERHQTLFALIEWSHNLLSESERVLLRRLSVFAGGWSFDAVKEVCGNERGDDVLDLLTHLVDKSLVAVEEETEEARYRLPETIRQYARDKLFESGEAEQVRNRHLEFFLRFAEQVEPKLRSAEQLAWLDRVQTEHDNMRTALAWSLESGRSDRALRLAGTLFWFWYIRGYFSEGQKWLDDALTFAEREQSGKVLVGETYTPTRIEKAQRAKALYGAGVLHTWAFTDLDTPRRLFEDSLRLWRELGENWWIAVVLKDFVASAIFAGDHQRARAQMEEAVALARQVKDKWVLAAALSRLGRVLQDIDVRAAQPIGEEAVVVARGVGDKSVLVNALLNLAQVHYLLGNVKAMAPVVEEAMAAARAIESKWDIGMSVVALAMVALAQGDPGKATAYSMQLLALGRETGMLGQVGIALLIFGCAAIASGQAKRGVQLLAMLEAMARRLGMRGTVATGIGGGGSLEYTYKQYLDLARAQLDLATFTAAWADGQQMTIEHAIALATEKE